jgi:hypothetical protein
MRKRKKIINCQLSIVNCLVLTLLMMSAASMNAQVRIGDTTNPTAGAVLDLNNTTADSYKGGLLLPKVNIANPDTEPVSTAISTTETTALEGLIVYNIASGKEGIYVWNGSNWFAIWKK